jgi:bla regulator protein BlaR1
MRNKCQFEKVLTTLALLCLMLPRALRDEIAPPVVEAQTTSSFAVATIRPNHSGGPPIIRPTRDEIRATNVTLVMLIANAYEEGRIDGAPNWADSETYDLEAKLDPAEAEAFSKLNPDQRAHQLDLKLEELLAERTKLAVHRGTKEVPAYALVMSKGGAKFKEAKSSDPDLTNGALRMTGTQITGEGVPLASLAGLLARQLGRPVLDKTGLTGKYDFSLQWEPEAEAGQSPAGGDHNLQSVPSVDAGGLMAAVRSQLGLKLDPAKTEVEVLVVDHLERPSGN